METMLETREVTVPCPSCGRSMSFRDKSWQCLACHPEPDVVPICATVKCRRPLTRLGEPWNCWICLHCNDHPDVVNKRMRAAEQKKENKRVDHKVTEERLAEALGGQMTEEKVRDIIRETIAEFNLKEEPDLDYPPARAEIIQLPEVKAAMAKPETWLQKAKRLGVATHIPGGKGMRKKDEILADMEKIENGGSSAVENQS